MEKVSGHISDSWMADASCKGMNGHPFFPEGVGQESSSDREEREAVAKQICGSCAVREECLEFALKTHQDDGIWGGMNARERRLIRSRRAYEARSNE